MRPRRTDPTPHEPDIEETDGTSHASACLIRLVIVYPRTHAGVHLLDEHEAILGRHAGPVAQVAVAHPTVSRRHAALRWAARRHSLADLGSRNGTWLNGQPVSALPRPLDDQAIVRVGSVIAVYERQDSPVVDPPAVSRTAIPGDSLAIQNLRAAIARAGPDPSPALILGETGSGKRSVAAELHRLSGAGEPRRTIDCATLGPQLGEPRIALCEIAVPSLRARRADLLGWIDRLHAAWAAQRDRSDLPPLEFQPDAAEALLLQPWPDNLRGLRRFVHACSAIADPVPIHRAELGPWLSADLPLETGSLAITPVPTSVRNARPRPSREALLAILNNNGWSIRATARHYERDRKQISRWIEMYALVPPGPHQRVIFIKAPAAS